jgi:hypothetical protein
MILLLSVTVAEEKADDSDEAVAADMILLLLQR